MSDHNCPTTIHTVLDQIRSAATSEADKGARFEELTRQYLLHDPVYQPQFSNVWRWMDYPGREGKADTGIDLVAERNDGSGFVAIQCKCYDPDTTIQKSHIDSFLATSGKKNQYTDRIIVSSTPHWSNHAEDAIHGQNPPVHRIDLTELNNSAIDWSQFNVNKPKVTLKPKKELRPHQKTALDQVRDGFKTQDRGQLIMACGTGKTFTSLKIAEEHAGKGGLVLFLVPSLSLLSQTLREWLTESAIPLHCYAVCSDTKIGKHNESDPTSLDDLEIPATTDGKELSKSMAVAKRTDKMTVVFSTYQSIEVIIDAQKKGVPEFDITNSKRAKKQKETPITVIIGNPPYSVGQKSENDANKNTAYPQVDDKIRTTYAAATNATNKNSLYDSYIRSFRWASDRIGDKGIVCYVSNGSYIDGNAMDGFRKCLANEFTDIYVFNLRGNARTSGEERRKEKGNVFGEGTRTPVAITLLIKNPQKRSEQIDRRNKLNSLAKAMAIDFLEDFDDEQSRNRKIALQKSQTDDCVSEATIHYHDIGNYLDQKEKLQILADAEGLQGVQWETIIPNEKHDWINQRDNTFDTFISLGDKKDDKSETVFDLYSCGLQTNRDAWCYNFSRKQLAGNMKRMIEFYNEQVEGYNEKRKYFPETTVDDFIDNDPTKISWSSSLKSFFERQVKIQFSSRNIVPTIYRPFCKTNAYFDGHLNHRVYQIPKIFSEPGMENLVICVLGRGATHEFCTLIANTLPDLEMVSKANCFPLYTYERVESKSKGLIETSGERVGDYVRRENISDTMLQKFRKHYGDKKITKEDIFYYVYGILHSGSYRERFAADLKKQLPRIPMVDDFRIFSKAGRQLAALHLNYETSKMYPLKEVATGSVSFKVRQMKYPSKLDKSKIIYNGTLTLDGIPLEAYRYIVNGKSALDWIVERYAVTKHKDSGIVNDPNDWCKEQGNERYIVDLIKRIVHLSVESVKIIEGLPEVRF